MILTIALVTALFRPIRPTVGDPVTVEFQQAVQLDPSPAYEVVSKSGNRIVLRTFQAKPLPLSGVTDGVHFQNLVLPVYSVLKPHDEFKPAPLHPPRDVRTASLPYWLIGLAALAAIAAWVVAILRRSAPASAAARKAMMPPAPRFEAAVRAAASARQKWAALADATRVYLDARGVGHDLTTSEVIAALPARLSEMSEEARRHHQQTVVEVLRRGDLEKFSPWGAPPGDFEPLARRALDLIPVFEPPPVVEEAAA